jgi:hypothetical protein
MDSEHLDPEHDPARASDQPDQPEQTVDAAGQAEPSGASEPTQPLTQPLEAAGPSQAPGDTPPETPPDQAQTQAPGSAPVLRIEVGRVSGDLRVYGRESNDVEMSSPDMDDDDFAEYAPTQEGPDLMRFTRLPDDAELAVPRSALVSVREVGGELRVDDLSGGGISVGRVSGDTVITGTARVELGRVEGDLRVTRAGLVRVREMSGDVVLEALSDTPVLGRVDGDLKIRGTRGLNVRDTISGDAQIEGSAADIVIRGSVGGDLQIDGCAGEVHVGTVSGDLSAKVARALIVDGAVAGDCEVTEIGGPVELRGSVGGDLEASLIGGLAIGGAVGGDAELATVAGETTLRAVGGDLTSDALAGPLVAQTIGGDARLRTSLGEIRLNRVGGDLAITRATAGFIVARVSGDVVLDTPLAAGAEYEVRAAGDISLRVRGDVNARFVAQTLGGEIRTRLPLAVERGRRRNLVGVLGRGDATVTLQSDGGDIYIGAAEGNEDDMSDQTSGNGPETGTDEQTGTGTGTGPKTWQGSFGGHKFRLRWDPGAWKAGEGDTSSSGQGARRGFGFEWEHDPEGGRQSQENFEQMVNDLRERAEGVARSAADQALRYAERAAKRVRETDWESIGREVRSAIERAMSELESTVGQVQREFESRRGSGGSSAGGQRPSGGGAQRVRIEQDEANDPFAGSPGAGFGAAYGAAGGQPGAAGGASAADVENRRRAILEELRAGSITLDEAERRLGELK